MPTDVVMPQMGESIAEGTITKWLKKVGDRVERDEPLFEISTDKVDAEIPSPAAGILTEIKFNEGDTVEVNKVIAVLDGGGAAAASEPAPAVASPATPPAEPVAPPEEVVPKTAPPQPPSAPVQEAAKAQEAETPAPATMFDPGAPKEAEAPPLPARKLNQLQSNRKLNLLSRPLLVLMVRRMQAWKNCAGRNRVHSSARSPPSTASISAALKAQA